MDFQPGDVIAFAGRGLTSSAIRLFTCSRYSHVGGIAFVDRFVLRGDPRFSRDAETWQSRHLLFESTTLATVPCTLLGRKIEGVQAHEPAERIAAYEGAVWRLRLRPDWALEDGESLRLARYLLDKVGREYSAATAALAGGNIVKRWLRRPESFHYVFCSQLWAGALERINRFPQGNVGTVNPGELVKRLVYDGTYLPPERLK